MNRVSPRSDWPTSWVKSYEFDRQEVFGEIVYKGYTYAYQNRMRHTLEMVKSVAPKGAKNGRKFCVQLGAIFEKSV